MNDPVELFSSKEVISALLQALATIGAVWVAYRFGLKHMHQQTMVQIQQDLRLRKAHALQAAWSLLRFLGPNDNGRNVVHWVKPKIDPGSSNPIPTLQYLMHIPNAQDYVFHLLPTVFYESGAGILWSRELKEKFFESRTILYGYLLAEGQNHARDSVALPQPLRPIQQSQLADRINTLYVQISELLRSEMKGIYIEKNEHLVD